MTCPFAGPDIVSREHKRDPFSFYARLRAEAPVARVTVPRLGDAWFLTRQADVVACLMDDRSFVRDPHTAALDIANDPDALLVLPHPSIGPTLLQVDDLTHKRLRMSVVKGFTRNAIEKWRAQSETVAEKLLDRMAERAEVDLVTDYARPLPLTIISAMLGMPVGNGHELPEWYQIFLSQSEQPGGHSSASFWSAFEGWAKQLFHARRRAPQDDLASALACSGDAGEGLDEREFIAMVHVLLFAGHETTAALIASGVLVILENSVEIDKFFDNRDLFRRAIEELLRFCAPVEMVPPRFVAEDVVIDGQLLRRGDIVFPVLASANRDEARFSEPDRLNLERESNPHVAFGAGSRHCFGLHLARMEAEVAFRSLFRRFPRLSLNPNAPPVWRSRHVVRALDSLPVRLG
jgi:cytochrome P450 PksS